jgi:hypothetical protein
MEAESADRHLFGQALCAPRRAAGLRTARRRDVGRHDQVLPPRLLRRHRRLRPRGDVGRDRLPQGAAAGLDRGVLGRARPAVRTSAPHGLLAGLDHEGGAGTGAGSGSWGPTRCSTSPPASSAWPSRPLSSAASPCFRATSAPGQARRPPARRSGAARLHPRLPAPRLTDEARLRAELPVYVGSLRATWARPAPWPSRARRGESGWRNPASSRAISPGTRTTASPMTNAPSTRRRRRGPPRGSAKAADAPAKCTGGPRRLRRPAGTPP